MESLFDQQANMEPTLEDILDSDVFSNSDSNSLDAYHTLETDWFTDFFDDPVLNDKMMSDALTEPPIFKSEHSYSAGPDSPLNVKTEQIDIKDCDMDALSEGHIDVTSSPVTSMTAAAQIKQEPLVSVSSHNGCHRQPTHVRHVRSAAGTSVLRPAVVKQPTIIVATTQPSQTTVVHKQERLVLPKVSIKVEPKDTYPGERCNESHNFGLPPTPPSSHSSDSEGGLSPHRSCPTSPIRSGGGGHLHHSHLRQVRSYSQHLFTSPIPTSGVLILTEEEKRTLIQEGYPVPTKLPLSKQEEKNLKKIRRKIKNKISAQESRRKKKEYMETLEKRMEGHIQENTELRKKVESLESNNRSLSAQLSKLQQIVNRVAPSSNATSTCLMVLVLCFSLFLGAWSPAHLAVRVGGLTSSGLDVTGMLPAVASAVDKAPMMGPAAESPTTDVYETPNVKSRVLMSLAAEDEETCWGPNTPLSYGEIFNRLFTSTGGSDCRRIDSERGQAEPSLPETTVTADRPQSAPKTQQHTQQAIIHPDIAAEVVAKIKENMNTTE